MREAGNQDKVFIELICAGAADDRQGERVRCRLYPEVSYDYLVWFMHHV